MNTLLLAPELFASDGGIPRILRLYLKALCELAGPKGRVDVVALNDASFDSRELRRYSDHHLGQWAACGRKKVRFVQAARRLSATADLVVCGHIRQLSVVWALRKLRKKPLRYVAIAHGIEVWRPFTPLERFALRGADAVWCVSDYTRRELLRHCPSIATSAIVVPNALDPALDCDTRPQDAFDLDILTVSRLNHSDRYKGVDTLIDALPAIRRGIPAARLRVVGAGNDLARLQTLTRKLSLEGAVKFLGHVGDAELKRELAACRVFALPSEKEGFGLVFLEAMAHGRPCIGTRDGGIPEVITPETGMLVPYGDVPALAEACIGALRRTWDVDALRARAAHFSYSAFRDRLARHTAALCKQG